MAKFTVPLQIEQAREIYQVWEQHFLAYSLGVKAYQVTVTSD
ncbi:hypothetical protein swp_4502 [Shewanella piezotolerans WP3]|uniref:Uncharacterized protein n=1 Tax=Shewanella piezotolerans (strain WP3 / JCM 13877) TaxID=225849 RepID=B8CUF3_SHEPW|nr:hypothetical protein swp_4502 [Shewanella piezotolerans WP3]